MKSQSYHKEAIIMNNICSSCKIRIANDSGTARFQCPECGKSEIVRCTKCRTTAVKYKCAECEFEGPN